MLKFKLTLALTTTLEMAYFNESKSIWEPVIEPIEQKNDKYSPYTLIIEVIFQISTFLVKATYKSKE